MARNHENARQIDAIGHSIKELFQDRAYRLDYFQRDYVWEEPQVEKLVTDLSEKFLRQWRPEHTASDVEIYDPYFLGPFIVYDLDRKTFLADGQQRIVTLLLLLIYLRHLVADEGSSSSQEALLATLISQTRFGVKTFAVDVKEYAVCFDALLHRRGFSVAAAPDYLQRIWAAYHHIEAHYPHDLRGESLPLFVEWLLRRVVLVALHAGDRDGAIEMFQSMNDRGVHLSSLDHLKRYLLEDADGDPRRLDSQWRHMVSDLEAVERGAAPAYVQAFFRARYLRSRDDLGPSLQDATHEWVLAHQEEIWPNRKNGDKARFFTELLAPLKSSYVTLLRARARVIPGLDAVRFNAVNGITEQFDLTLAAAQPDDSKPTRERKARLVANFIDLFVVTNAVNNDPCGQKEVDALVAELLPAVRLTRSEDELRRVLGEAAAPWPTRFIGILTLRMHNNRPFVHYLLARLTAWLEVAAQRPDPIDRYLARPLDDRGYEVEHLFTSTAAKYADLVPDADDYGYLRSRLGALVLLDGPDNGGYGGDLLAKKLPYYRGNGALAGSLIPDFFVRGNARLKRFVKKEGLADKFTAYVDGDPPQDLVEARSVLYLAMAERIWSLDALGLAIPPEISLKPPKNAKRTRRSHGTQVADLMNAGHVRAGDRLVGHRRGKPYYAEVLPAGRIRTASGSVFPSLSPAATDVLNTSAANGWTFWHLDRTGESLDAMRKRLSGGR